MLASASWPGGARAETKTGYPNGVYYSHALGKGKATYRFANLPRGYGCGNI